MCDSHTHLVADEIKQDLEFFIRNFGESGGEALLSVGYSIETNLDALEIGARFKNSSVKVLTGIGMHPDCFVPNSFTPNQYLTAEQTAHALRRYEEIFNENLNNLAAVGETGLDYHNLIHDETLTFEQKELSKELQKTSFRKHLELAQKHSLPLSIHTRDNQGEDFTIVDAIKCVCEYQVGQLKGCFHSYTGDIKYVDEILDLGFYIGVNGICTYPKADNVREIVKKVPLERILLETDAPYLPPQSIRNNRKLNYRLGQPADIAEIEKAVAEIKRVSVEKVQAHNKENFTDLFVK